MSHGGIISAKMNFQTEKKTARINHTKLRADGFLSAMSLDWPIPRVLTFAHVGNWFNR